MPSASLLAPLTPPQREAVTHVDGPLLILAGPGSGKTRVVTHRIAYLIEQGVRPREILALTFTNKAAEEMQRRVEELAPGCKVWTSTFHRFCARLLRSYGPLVGLAENFTIYDTSDRNQALARTIDELGVELAHFGGDQIANAIGRAKNQLVPPDEFQPRPGHPLDTVVARVYQAYQKRLLDSAAADFDDLLLHVALLLRDNPEVRRELDARYRYVLVDEYQDTNRAQYAIVRALSYDYPNLAVTGDPDQSIYGWRGAHLGNILDFEKDYPDVRVVRLEQNWRSSGRILEVADALISHNRLRKPKRLHTTNEPGRPVELVAYPTHHDEAEGIATRIAAEIRGGERRPRDFAIFYRINALSRSLEDALREQGVPYQLVHGLEFYQRKEVRDVVAYLRLINNPRDDVALLRIINTPPRGIGKVTIARLQEHAARNGLRLLEAARESGMIEALPTRAATRVAKFVSLIDELRSHATEPAEAVLGYILERTGYLEPLLASDLEEDQNRVANIQELLTAARESDERHPEGGQLEAFLENASLVSDTDPWETENDKVTLMTLHGAKGLEFPVVFIVALEEGLLPHQRSRDDPRELEEERRLLFVGITRAEQQLHLSHVIRREFRGQRRVAIPSPFLMELPRDEMHVVAPDWTVETWESDDEPEWSPPAPAPPRKRRTAAASATSVTTAAELAEPQADEADAPALPAVSPDVFCQGMIVTHPKYGLGKIVALGGTASQRMATVAFATAGEKKFVLASSKLRPAREGGGGRGGSDE